MKPTEFMLEIERLMKEKRGVSDTSALQYLQTLYKLNGSQPFKNLAWCKKHEEIEKRLENYSLASKRNMVTTLVATLSLFDKKAYKSCLNYWREEMSRYKSEYNSLPANEKNEKQEKEWIQWEDVLKKRSELSSEISSFASNKTITAQQYDKLLQHVLLSLYTYIQPRRNQDYLAMSVSKKLPKEFEKDKNWYDIATGRLIFNKYKTAKKYGEQVETIPEELQQVLKTYLVHHPLAKVKQKEFPLLVKADGVPLTTVNAITRILNRIFSPKKVGASMLRHSYLSSKYGTVMKEMEADATAMGHSKEEAQSTYIKFEKS